MTDIVEGAADAVVLSGADRHASPVRGHRYRHPRVVDRILTVDVAANLGPRPAALRVHAHVAAVVASFSVAPMATRVPSADIDTVRPDQSPAASPSMSPPTWVHVPPLSEYTRT